MGDSLNHLFTNFQACRYLGLAGYVIYMYDFLLTYSDVQRLIWPSPMGVVKACYYFNRFLVPICLTINTWQMSGLSGPLSPTFCKEWIAAVSYLQVISLGVSSMILLLRVYALYGRSKRVLFGLLAFFTATQCTVVVIATLSVLAAKDQVTYSLTVKACIVQNKPPFLASIWAASIALEVLIFCMTLYKGIEHARTVRSIANSPILYTLYRDGLGYFVVIIIVKLFNLVIWCIGDKSIVLLGIYFIWGLITALISRLLLNLRGVEDTARRRRETSLTSQSASKTEGSTFMQTGWFERTQIGTETVSTITDNARGRHDYWEEGMGLAAGTYDVYLGSIEREALQRREQEMKERRLTEKEKWREQYQTLQITPKYGPSYPLNDFSQRVLVIGQDDTFLADEETIAEPTSAQSVKFAIGPYDPTLNDSYPDLFQSDLEQRRPPNPQRTPHQHNNEEIGVTQQESFLPSPREFRTNTNSTLRGLNIERLLLQTRRGATVGTVGRPRSSRPGNMRTGNLPISPTTPNPRISRPPPRNPPR